MSITAIRANEVVRRVTLQTPCIFNLLELLSPSNIYLGLWRSLSFFSWPFSFEGSKGWTRKTIDLKRLNGEMEIKSTGKSWSSLLCFFLFWLDIVPREIFLPFYTVLFDPRVSSRHCSAGEMLRTVCRSRSPAITSTRRA